MDVRLDGKCDGEAENDSLTSLFSEAEKQLEQLDGLSTQDLQLKTPAVISGFEKATKWVSVLGLFSNNEEVEEVTTSDLRYFLLPAYLAHCTLQLQDNRADRLETAEIYALDFLRRCKNYSLPGSESVPENVFHHSSSMSDSVHNISQTQQEQLAEAAGKRAAKIAAYRQKAEAKEKTALLKPRVLSGSVDDEIQRDYCFSLIKTWILEITEELPTIREEKKLLEFHAKEDKDVPENAVHNTLQPPKSFRKVNQPITIVRNELQKQVFGAGYRSLPLLTIEEFYDELVQEGALPAPGSVASSNLSHMGPSRDQLEDDQVQLERKEENDDPQHLIDIRNRDDFRDNAHRTGWGNRIGKG